MISITPNPTFSVAVMLTVPGRQGGHSVRITFRHKGRRALLAWMKGAEQHLKDDSVWLDEVIADWNGPQGADGTPVPYSRNALAELLDTYPASGQELLAAYLREFRPNPIGEARSGN